VDAHEFIAYSFVFVVYFLFKSGADLLVECFQPLGLASKFVLGVLCIIDLAHFSNENVVLFVDFDESVWIGGEGPLRDIYSLWLA
jgi:hypothetical protein